MKTYIFANTQYCGQHYVTYPYCQPVFPISADLFKYNNYWWYFFFMFMGPCIFIYEDHISNQ